MTDYIIKIDGEFYSPFCKFRRSPEYPDATIFTKIQRATVVARQLATLYPLGEIQVWRDYGLAKEAVVLTFNEVKNATTE
jgi:hypothetical protein